MTRTEPQPVLILMGSNVEPRVNIVRAAALLLESFPGARFSRVFETEPVGAPESPWFLNAAAAITTDLGPRELKFDVLRPLESRLGRRRSANRNAPRTIDLDIALYGGAIIKDSSARLDIPDPEILTSAHIALPLADLEPDMLHPVTRRPLREIAAELLVGPVVRAVIGLELGVP